MSHMGASPNMSMDSLPEVCIIVPVYNGERYLAECLDSLLAQTYPNISIFVVNDGSTDGSQKIIDDYASADKGNRFGALETANGGLSYARNNGIERCTAEYVSFVDADDCLHPQAIEMLMNGILETGAMISACDFGRGKQFKPKKFAREGYRKLSYRQAVLDTCYQKIKLNPAWGKIYKRTIFEDGCLFREGILYEDIDSFYRFFEVSENVCYLPVPLYFYRENPGSLIQTWRPQRLDVLDVTDRMVEYMRKRHPELVKAAEDRRFSAHYNMYLTMLAYGVDNPRAMDRCRQMIHHGRRQALLDPHVRLKNKLGALLSFCGEPILKLFARKG